MERRAVTVRGIVQGVGFRPHVFRLAQKHQLSGWVRNDSGVVRIEAQGNVSELERFCQALVADSPRMASIDGVDWVRVDCQSGRSFEIIGSATHRQGDVLIAPDVATCEACLRELFDAGDRRYRYPFINCTNCGPRLSIVLDAPYDRQRTTMADFAMCGQCRQEYEDPGDRRFHAEPTCCPQCGPKLRLLDGDGRLLESSDPLAEFANRLRGGAIGALKGLGGYHLVCDATSPAAVGTLRRRKRRDDKPFGLMLGTLDQVDKYCQTSASERELLAGAARPLVLVRRRTDTPPLAEGIAPGNPFLGIMLPYTPLHHLLVEAVGEGPLVMTSGNRASEPIAYRDDQAIDQLSGIADCYLTHDREIHVRCEDSVMCTRGSRLAPVRRSRGFAPRPIELPSAAATPLLAVGGQLKGTFALGRDRQAVISHHLGDLDDFEAYRAFERDVALYEELFDVRPACIVHDLHPDYASSQYARRRAERDGMPTVAVQHHHAHVAACLAEHQLAGEVIGVAFDGTGLGTDGTIWGGEFLIGGYEEVRRAAHLRAVALPGGDRAVREPWRAAAAHLLDAVGELSALDYHAEPRQLSLVRQMIERGVNSPRCSSAGRLFDAVTAIAGVRAVTSFEGQAAMELEWLATDEPSDGAYPFAFHDSSDTTSGAVEIDTRPLIAAVLDDVRRGVEARRIARRFHCSLVEIIVSTCQRLRASTDLDRVALSGGVFLNQLLGAEVEQRLQAAGFRVFAHERVPPGDGGLCLGQLAVAVAKMTRGESATTIGAPHHLGNEASPSLAASAETTQEESKTCVWAYRAKWSTPTPSTMR